MFNNPVRKITRVRLDIPIFECFNKDTMILKIIFILEFWGLRIPHGHSKLKDFDHFTKFEEHLKMAHLILQL